MRPRKRLLLWCADEAEASVLSYALELRLPVRVLRVRSGDEALAFMSGGADLHGALVVETRLGDGAGMVADFLIAHRERCMGGRLLPILLYDVTTLIGRDHCAEMLIQGRNNEALVEGLKMLLARNRGPRKPVARVDCVSDRAERCA